MITQDNVEQYLNGVVTDESGDKIGNVGDIYFDDQTNKPSWVTVNTGLFGNKSSFIPLENASFDGDQIRVPFSKDKVKDAPHFGDDGHISEEEERELFRYYGQDYDAGWTDGDRDRTRDADGDVDADRRRAADTDTEGVVRHEEQLNVGTREREPAACVCASTSPPRRRPSPCRCSARRSASCASPSRRATVVSTSATRSSARTPPR
ncbi:PRC-barrel domain-containing protein [Arsenicicoccus piscis]|uniref:PRC-barrel domain-containing protein n=1 Tax=Arsenicicoccus piscis TaxID=673954 RepID=A0ABQ6HX62_9MICO|nr:hypothetical protein GCM10025862_41520 [Arsenicicoccus piscis]